MYEGCFGLNQRPFASVPQAEQYFPAGTIEAARTTLSRAVERGEGAGWVVGPSGTGKTLLCLLLAERFRRSFQVAMLASGRLSTRRALFQAILYELGRPYRQMDEGELRLAVVDYLTVGDDNSQGLVLLIDEAHTLPLRLLDEVRLLTNLSRNGQPLVRLVLAGAPALEERFASPKLDSFSQRLTARCYLEAFNRTETREYVQAQICRAGGRGDAVFPERTCQSVFQATGGVPRLVNQVCDHALLLACVAGRKTIEPANIEEAWADLQQLPTPWNGEAPNESVAGSVIEFGSLDDSSAATESSVAGVTPSADVFRMTSAHEQVSQEETEPAEQIHRIERLLAEADDEFQPAGSAGPEIELCFDECHPFEEEFQHEEIVSDRYGAARTAWVTKPVIAAEAERRPAWPATCQTPTQQPCRSDWISTTETMATPAAPESWASWTGNPLCTLSGAADDTEVSAVCASSVAPQDASVGILRVSAVPEASAARHVVNEPDHGQGRTRQYRQLFSRLRRG